jgi:hypothetical protein
MDQMAVKFSKIISKYTKWPFQGLPKIFLIWYANLGSGNPGKGVYFSKLFRHLDE